MSLSVVSALGRLGVDPWREAARLAGLPAAAAADALAALIAPVPGEAVERVDLAGRATQLIGLLPKPSAIAPAQRARRPLTRGMPSPLRKSNIRFTVICLVLAVAAFGTALAGQTLFSRDAAPSPPPFASSKMRAE
jgi:hypothetical protein